MGLIKQGFEVEGFKCSGHRIIIDHFVYSFLPNLFENPVVKSTLKECSTLEACRRKFQKCTNMG